MQFKEAFEAMKKGKKVKYPNWLGWILVLGSHQGHCHDAYL